jgi:hypothetical protein
MMFRTLYRAFLLTGGAMLGETIASYTVPAGTASHARLAVGWLAGGGVWAAGGVLAEYVVWRVAVRRWRRGRSI